MKRTPRPRRCPCCLEMFTPVMIGLKLSTNCGDAGCVMDAAQGVKTKAKKPKPKPKVKTAAKLKKELWPIFSLHQKLVHSEDGRWCQCYTCGKPLEIGTTNCQGGHCLSKAVYKNLFFDERAVRPQCYYCNINLGGMHYDFCEALKLEIGVDSFDEMKRQGRDVVKRDAKWYLDSIEYYTEQNKNLKAIKQ